MLRIELSSGGLGTAVLDFQSDLATYISDAEDVISSFKTVRNSTCSLSGGVGSLQTALDNIEVRIQNEERKKEEAENVQKKVNTFLQLADQVDRQVASMVEQNTEEFYQVNPWLRPALSTEEAHWYDTALNWLYETAVAIVEQKARNILAIKDTAVKIYNGAVEFYQEHKKVIDTILIVVGAVAAIAAVLTGTGWALVPLLMNVFAVEASTAMAISSGIAVAAVVSTAASSAINVADVWMEIDNPVFNTVQSIANISSGVLNFTYSIGNIYNSFMGYRITSFQGIRVIQNDKVFDPVHIDDLGRTNLERMTQKSPLAPLGTDENSVNLHHLLQTEDGGLMEITSEAHSSKYSFLHKVGKGVKSVVDHGTPWSSFKKDYWRWRATTSHVVQDTILKNLSWNNLTNSTMNVLETICNIAQENE